MDPRTAPRSPDSAWQAVLARDASLDGALFYGVRTTGVYCRPSCPSRRPRRENVAFFESAADAEREGFRACARCGPGAAHGRAERAVERAKAYIEARLDERLTLAAIAAHAGASPWHLQRTFRRLVGISPRAYQDARRLAAFKERVRGGESVGAATYAAGYGSSRGLYESARAGLGMTPAVYRQGGKGEVVRYAAVDTALGRLLVAATARGTCAVLLGDDDAPLVAELTAEFPRARLERDEGGMAGALAAVAREVEGGGASGVPLDLRGTAFQLRVWQALREIPPGETRSYASVADAIGAPGAARAVAGACAANRLAVLVPCHRVVRGGGAVSGYRWGVERKRRLLEAEAATRARRERDR